MSELTKVFFASIEEFARTMKTHTESTLDFNSDNSEVIKKLDRISEKLDIIISKIDEKFDSSTLSNNDRGKRMMDIKQRIQEVVEKHSDGIRPPKIAKLLGTKVQNLYPHLKFAVSNNKLEKDNTGCYFPVKSKKAG